LYFTSSIFDYKTEQKNNISSKTKDNHNIIQENNMVVTNNSTTALLTENKPKTVFKKIIDKVYKKELAENYNEELAEKEEFERESEHIETRDAPRKAVEQDNERTKDPALNRPTPEVLPGVILNGAIQSFSNALLGLPGAGSSTSWIQRGPDNIGGRTRTIAWDPNDVSGKKVWAGGVSGGLWYNNDITDPNSNWINVGDVWLNLSVTKIVFDPTNSQNIYVATGEGFYSSSTRGAGIWKSTDGGNNWSQISASSGYTYINDLAVRVESGVGVLYVAVDDNFANGAFSSPSYYYGLYRSTNQGSSFSQVMMTNPLPNGTNRPFTIASISIGSDNRIWVGTKNTAITVTDQGGGKILYSDNGTSWTISKEITVPNWVGRVSVATAPSNANYVYAFVETSSSSISLVKTTDKGANWSDMSIPDDIDSGVPITDICRGQASYDQVINVDPNNHLTVYVGGINLFKSTDAGTNWSQISKWVNYYGMENLTCSIVHSDQHTMVFKPGSSTTAVFGNDGGIYYSNDLANAITNTVINERNSKYNVTQFYTAAIHPTANRNYYLAGAQDNGTQQFVNAGLSSTQDISGGDGAYCFIDQTNPNIQVTSYVYNNVYRSTNGGNSFLTILDDDNSGSFINPACYDNNLHIYYSYKNNNGTDGFIKRVTGMNATPSVSDVPITGLNTDITAFKVSPHTILSTTLFIGTSNSKILKVINANGSPTSTVINTAGITNFPTGASISCIDIGANENELLVTFFNYGVERIWYTSNGGTTWSNKMGSGVTKFPNIPVRWGMFNPNNRSNDVLLATELGIYGTTNFSNANPTWTQLNNGFTNVRTDMLQYRASDKQVIAATYGRGLYSSYGFAVKPSITSFTPTTASTGTTVTITGTDFDAITGVSFGGVAAASYTVTSSTSITAVVAGGASGNIAVTNSAGTGSLAGFTYCATANASLTSSNSNNQTVCQNTAISSITYSTTNVTGVTITGVPSLTASYNANVVTISGAPTSAGVYTFTVAFTGGCQTITATGTITVTASNTLTLSSAAGTNSQSVCFNSAITSVTYTSTGATTATVTGLPTGVSYTFVANTVTISGTPTATGTYNYTLTTSGGCGPNTATGTIIVNENTITLSSAASTASQTICNNTPIANITYNTTGATDASFTGLPGGVTGTWAANVITISGTPTPTSGNFTYTITLTGGCGTITKTGTITIQPTNTLTLSSGAGTNSKTVCIGTAIPSTTYTTTGATNATVTGLPTGITSSWSANVLTISGTPTVAGNYSYTVTTVGGCGVITATGNFIVNQNAIALSSATGTDVQTICSGTSITSITYTTTLATGANFNGLPGGLSASWSANTITISGTPTPTSGTFNYTITLTGGCGTVTKTGTIIISFPNTITLGSAAGTNSQTICINTSITPTSYNTTDATGATVTGLPAGLSGLWSNNVYTINGIPTASGTYSYTVTTTGGCGVASTTGKYIVTPSNTFTLTSATGTNTQTVCVNNAISNITYATTGATNVTVIGLPSGVTSSWAANILTISGTPTANGTFNYTMTTIGGCGPITATGTITVKRNTITLSSAAGTDSQTICINSAITNITFATTGATGATISGLPANVIGSWSGNVYTISGTPSLFGTFNYTITLTGGCDVVTKSGVIQVSPVSIVGTASAASSSICPNSSASLTLSDFTGNLVWQQSINGTTWTDVTSGTGINSLNYTTQALNTNYSYRAKEINGNCSAGISNVVNITILATPIAPEISNANITKFCNGDSVKLSSTIATGLAWYNNDVLIPAQTASTYYVKATGTYSAKVFVSGCPSANSNIIKIDRIESPITPVVTDVSLCKDATPITLNAIASTGNTLLWYGTNATGGTSSTNANSITTSAIGTSNYYVSQISTFGCESIRVKIAVNIYGIPSAPSITRDNTNNLISSYTYGNTWYKDQVKLADTTNMIKPVEQGSYTVKAIVNTCPSSFSMPYFYLNSVTDITNLNQNEFIKIYPNPIVSDLKINFSLTKFQKVNVSIYSSTTGGKIIDLMNKESEMIIDVRNLISGTYIVIIRSKDNQVIYTQKIMKL